MWKKKWIVNGCVSFAFKYIYSVKLLVIVGFPTGDLFSIRSFLKAGTQTCQLFKNDLMTTSKRSKETNSDFIATN